MPQPQSSSLTTWPRRATNAATRLESELAGPFLAWRSQPTPVTAGALLRAIQPILSSAMQTYAPGAGPAVAGRAKMLALSALERYDPRQAKLRSYLLSQLQSLRRVGREAAEPIRIPERVTLDAYNMEQSKRELEDRLGREPTSPELSDHSGLSLSRIAYVRKAKPAMPEGQLMGQLAGAGGPGDAILPVAAIPPESHDAWTEFVYSDLAPQERQILEWSSGFHGVTKLPNQTIANKLGISPASVSQRRAKIQTKLDARGDFL